MTFEDECHDLAGSLRRQAFAAALAVLLGLVLLTAVLGFDGSTRVHSTVIALTALLAALASLALSALLRFDAALFALMGSYPDEISGGAAVDDFLARAKLKARPAATRPLASRVAGARRLLICQRLILAAFAFTCLLVFAAEIA